jgi:hypothetical protein
MITVRKTVSDTQASEVSDHTNLTAMRRSFFYRRLFVKGIKPTTTQSKNFPNGQS